MRTALTFACAACVAILAGCGLGDGLSPDEPVPVDNLRIKLRVLSTDPCNSDPRSQPPHGCTKFVTQLGNTANAVTEAGEKGYPRLADPARRMKQSTKKFRTGGCATKQPASEADCYDALDELAAAVTDAAAVLAQRRDPAGTGLR